MSNHDDPTTSAGDPESIYRTPTSDTSFAPKGDLLAAYVGPKNAAYYALQFERIKTENNIVSWNWPAFFLTSYWLLYRKMWLNAFGYWFVLPVVLAVLSAIVGLIGGETASDFFYYGVYLLIAFVFAPIYANRIYYRHAQNKINKVAAITSSAEQQSEELARIGGTSKVVLIILPFILVAVVGILAAIAIPAYQDYTIRAQVTEGLHLSAAVRGAVAEHFSATGELPYDNVSIGLSSANEISGMYVSSVAIDSGNVVITYGNQANAIISLKTIVMKPELLSGNMLSWTCSSPSIKPKYLPASCR